MTHRTSSWPSFSTLVLLSAAVAVAAAIASPAAAQEPRVRTVAGTGFYTLLPGHTAFLTLADVGLPETEPTEVVLRLRDREERVVREIRGQVAPGRILRLSLQGPSAGVRIVRAEAELVTSRTNFGTAPILTLETVNVATRDAFANAGCALAYDPEGTGGKVLGDCGGCQVLTEIVP
jgi:hypothetical protein